eukprot:m.29302 g.29302  ORF g.29302 m.29302 type:complete len:212 (+) comp6139_c0_seq1:53-688(+)
MKLYHSAGKRGLAEKIRMLLAETGLKYEEVPVDERGMAQLVSSGKLLFGALPAFEDGDLWLEGSTSIMNYIAELADAKKLGQANTKFLGEPNETARVRSVAESVQRFQYEVGADKGAEVAPENVKDIIKTWFGYIQAMLEANDDHDVNTDEYTVSQHLTYADIAMFEVVNMVVERHGMSTVRAFPKLKEIHDKIAGRARIERYIATRPDEH